MAGEIHTDYSLLAEKLEKEELDNGSSPTSIQKYSQLLAVYLYQNDMCNAKLLWKRIPAGLKQSSPELTNIWTVGQKMWQRDYVAAYEALQKDWSDDVKSIMSAVVESTRERGLNLVRLAYASISADNLSQFLGVSIDQAITAAEKEGWNVDENKIITPKKSDAAPAATILSEQHLSVLTDYVTFMEN